MAHNNDRGPDWPAQPASSTDLADVALSLNAILELLAHHHRRAILRTLSAAPDHTATVDELVARLVDKKPRVRVATSSRWPSITRTCRS